MKKRSILLSILTAAIIVPLTVNNSNVSANNVPNTGFSKKQVSSVANADSIGITLTSTYARANKDIPEHLPIYDKDATEQLSKEPVHFANRKINISYDINHFNQTVYASFENPLDNGTIKTIRLKPLRLADRYAFMSNRVYVNNLQSYVIRFTISKDFKKMLAGVIVYNPVSQLPFNSIAEATIENP